jgi:hypothetical protein
VFAPWVKKLASVEVSCVPAALPGKQEQVLEAPRVSVLDVELEPVLLNKAAMLGLPDPWVARLARLDGQRRQV